ncbi:MAG: UDP-glucose 4-epimerase GalE [candidate division WOR-3 bacterium]
MKVLVCGGAGYIGSVTSRLLSEAGHEVLVFDNLSYGHRSAVAPPARLVVGDLGDGALIERVVAEFRPDCVMHFAALIQVGESVLRPDIYFHNNVACGINLLNACGRNGVRRFVFSSTAAVYGTPAEIPVTEDAPLRPANPYGSTKAVFEGLLADYSRYYGLRYAALRYFNVAGAYGNLGEDHRPESHLIPRILRSVLHQGERFQIYGDDYETRDGTCIRDYVHVYDLAQAHILAMEALKERNLVYNLGSENGWTVREVFATCERVVGQRIAYEVTARRQGDVPVLVASSERIRRELGWRPVRSDLPQMIGDAWEWHKAHPQGYED